MSTRLTSAIVLGLAIIAAPLSVGAAGVTGLAGVSGFAGAVDTEKAASITAEIKAQTAVLYASPAWAAARTEPAKRAAMLKALVKNILAAAQADEDTMAAALVAAVDAKAISAGTAVDVSLGMGGLTAKLEASPVVQAGLEAQNATTASITAASDSVSLLTPTTGGTTVTTETVTAPYDPCIGTVAAYCG